MFLAHRALALEPKQHAEADRDGESQRKIRIAHQAILSPAVMRTGRRQLPASCSPALSGPGRNTCACYGIALIVQCGKLIAGRR